MTSSKTPDVEKPKVLVVEDERGLADLYSTWLDSDYEVRTAYGGESALEIVDDDTDVVLLDRRMPDLSGDEVLQKIRTRELGCNIAMVTAVEPEVDIVEMGFDDYTVKPIQKDEILELVERLLAVGDMGPGAKQYHSDVSKKSTLETRKDPATLADNPDIEDLNQGIEAYDRMIKSLAEEAIDAKKKELMSSNQTDTSGGIQKWEEKLKSLEEGDPLYQVARERLEELQADTTSGTTDKQVPFLKAIADGFIAEGLWLEPTVKRALNLTLHDKNSEEFVINRQPLTSIAEKDAGMRFEASQEIRDLASKKLQRLS